MRPNPPNPPKPSKSIVSRKVFVAFLDPKGHSVSPKNAKPRSGFGVILDARNGSTLHTGQPEYIRRITEKQYNHSF